MLAELPGALAGQRLCGLSQAQAATSHGRHRQLSVLRVACTLPENAPRRRLFATQQATRKSETKLLWRELLQSKDELLKAKDAQLATLAQSKDAQLATLAQSKDELVHSKDAQLAKDEQLMRALKDAAAAQLLASRADLCRAAEEATRTVEGVKLRSVVEYLAKTHGRQPSAQKGLDALFRDDAQLRLLLEAFSQEFKLLPVDLDRCAAGLYHTLSKELHGSEARCEVHEAHWRSPAERAALCALLERFSVAYSYVVNDCVVPSPFAVPALRVLVGISPLPTEGP